MKHAPRCASPAATLQAYHRTLAVLAAALLAAHLLAGCGGGDPEPDQANPAVNCALQPVVCR